jgi:excinuclease ABC subunit C
MKTDSTIRKKLHETALNAPTSSGVYLWRDEDGTILYVGKAKILKNRLCSYFSGKKDIKTRLLISRAFTIEYIVTNTEYEAFILENTLIKQHRPKYNIDLKDDKSYPALRITNEEFPRIFKTRHIIKDGSKYFGPFPNAGALDTFIEYLYRHYPLRYCKKFRKRNSPCMYYHIGRCKAPCCEKIDRESYNQFIGEICSFLDGKPEEITKKLQTEMQQCAKKREYEKAARLRDGIIAIQQLNAVATVNDFDPDARDYIGYAQEGPLVSFAVLKLRMGKLVMRDLYRTKSLNDASELISEFFMAYYDDDKKIPAKIFIDTKDFIWKTDNSEEKQESGKTETPFENVQQYISERFKMNPQVIALDSETKANLSEEMQHHATVSAMATHNAKEDIIRRERERGDTPAMEELQKLLHLDHLPRRIEGFDIAHLHGKFPVASLISFWNGNPDKKNYRYFRLKTTDGIIDDFASMREASARRYTRLVNEGSELPDLILIDGGIGQVNAVQGVLDSLDLDIPIIGLAKRDEEIYLPHNSTPVSLPKRSDALRLLQRVRDETHRFATSRNQELRTKENTQGNGV